MSQFPSLLPAPHSLVPLFLIQSCFSHLLLFLIQSYSTPQLVKNLLFSITSYFLHNFFLFLGFSPNQSLLSFCFVSGIECLCCLVVTFFPNSCRIGSQFLVRPQGPESHSSCRIFKNMIDLMFTADFLLLDQFVPWVLLPSKSTMP